MSRLEHQPPAAGPRTHQARRARDQTGGLLPRLTILALTMVPLLYGAVYLYANWDPYGKLDQIDAALVVEDTGATSAEEFVAAGATAVLPSVVDLPALLHDLNR